LVQLQLRLQSKRAELQSEEMLMRRRLPAMILLKGRSMRKAIIICSAPITFGAKANWSRRHYTELLPSGKGDGKIGLL
jgi:hypothetical protein